ncbi:MAG: hypothetical protein ACYS47_00115 [Planctomycetota bacterium]|jgi:Asp-tRNA(Asn)/Glu-tRNA(Gln) amidotransferase C subunit
MAKKSPKSEPGAEKSPAEKASKKPEKKAKPKRAAKKTSKKTAKKAAKKTAKKTPKKAPKKKTVKKAKKTAAKTFKEENLQSFLGTMEKVLKRIWKDGKSLSRRVEKVGRLGDQVEDRLASLQNGLEGLAQRIEGLENAPSKDRPDPTVSPDDVRAALRPDLENLREEIAGLGRSLEAVRAQDGSPRILEEVRAALKGDFHSIAARLAELEDAPPPEAGPSLETIRTELEQEIQILRARIVDLENAPAEEADAPPAGLRDEFEEAVRALAARVDALEQAAPPESAPAPEPTGEALEEELLALSIRVEALENVPSADNAPSPASIPPAFGEDLEALGARLDTVEKTVASTGTSSPEQIRAKLEEELRALGTRIGLQEQALKSLKPSTSEETIRRLISESGSEMVHTFKDRIKKIEAAIGQIVENRLGKRLKEVPTKQEMLDLVKKDAVEGTIREVVESGLFSGLLNSDEMKIVLDDKFKMMRNWLKNDEIPKQVKKLTRQ